MCILTAVSPIKQLTQEEVKLTSLLVTDLLTRNSSSANRDGCGFSTVTGNLVKWAVPFGSIAYTEECNNYLLKNSAEPLIAHVRAISTGTKDDAHPFKAGNLVLAHNGTLTNYRAIGKKLEMCETEMMDSRVLTEYLHRDAGTKELTSEHIIKALDEFNGSYSLLIGDCVGGNLWVVAGSCPLYIQQVGPLHIVNTSKLYLEATSSFVEAITSLLHSETWVAGEIKAITRYTVNVLNDNLTHVATITPKVSKVLTSGWKPTHPCAAGVPDKETKAARAKAMLFYKAAQIPYFSKEEVMMACHIALNQTWETVQDEFFATLSGVFTKISDTHGSPEKEKIWGELRELCGGAPYSRLSKEYDLSFPYMWNSVELLQEVLNEKRSAVLL